MVKNNWTIAVGNSETSVVKIYHVRGTDEQVKKKLLILVLEDQATDKESWDNGTEEVDEIVVTRIYGKDISYCAYNTFGEYHINYTAAIDTEPEVL